MNARRRRVPVLITYHNDLLAPGKRGTAFTVSCTLGPPLPWVLGEAAALCATGLDRAAHPRAARWAEPPGALREVPNGVDPALFRGA